MKNLIKIVFKSTLLLIVFCIGWVGLSGFFRTNIDQSGNQFRNLPKESMDMIILGSSHAQYSINPAVIYNETGLYSYVLGSGCQPMSMSTKFLEEALKTQKPEVVVLDVFTMMPAQEICYSDGMFYRAIQQMSGKTKIEAADLVDNKDLKYDYMFDLRMTHSNWKNTKFFGPDKAVDGFSPTFGYIHKAPTDFTFSYLIPFEKQNKYELKKKDIEMLDSIINLCKKNNIELILIKTPITMDQKNQDALEAIWDYADTKGIKHIDYLELAEELNFALGVDGDTWHNNSWGAYKTSSYLAQYIKENKLVNHHKTNIKLEEAYKKAEKETISILSVNQIDIYQLLEYASKYDMMVAVKYEGSRHSSIGKYENELLQGIGISHDFIKNKNTDYYAIINNKEILIESDEPIQKELNGTKYQILDNKIVIGNQEFDDCGELELIFFDEDMTWFQAIDIDYSSRFFWKNGCNGWNCK
ncbi:hypothetical protein [Anaerorhabdus sp.]|uniref:hypothetical protein n=1 Tax=Anaerorhabdus sp. TaxID=1872524 RepID=UPI002FC78BDA